MIQGFGSRLLSFIGATLLVVASGASWSQADTEQQAREQQKITPNFKDADITQIIEAVSAATGKNFIIDPRVQARVTMISQTPLSPNAFYEAFLSILQVYSFVAVPAGKVIKIIPDANARQVPAKDLQERVSASSDEIVTQVIEVKNSSAAQLVPILRPLVPQYGHLVAHQASNMLIISDRANNVNRIMRIIQRIDQASDSEVEVIGLQNASAADIVRNINSLYSQQTPEGGGGMPLKVVADERSNSVMLSGEPAARLRVKGLIAILDTPLETGGDTQVRYLRYAIADDMVKTLKEQVQGIVQSSGQPAAAGAAAAQQAARDVMISADKYNNALLITAPPKVMKSINAVVDKLDIRRAQVFVEAIICEVSADKSAELGVNWIVGPADPNDGIVPIGIFNQAVGGTSIGQVAAGALGLEGSGTRTTTTNTDGSIVVTETRDTAAASNLASALPSGVTMGAGRLAETGVNFVALLRAIRGDSNSNILSTPQTVTMDNEEAELTVAQEVPFLTGSYANTGAATGGTGGNVNPFQTIQRQEVGTKLKVTPQISSEGSDTVRLKIEIESSSLAPNSQGAVDLITNKRTIATNVRVQDGGIVVLGGLMSDQSLRGEQRVPFLGRIPLVGLLFKTRSARANKTTLMVFIRPKILRDDMQMAVETNSKYNYMRDEQQKLDKRELLPLLPGVPKPKLPPAPPMPEPSSTPAEPADTANDSASLQDAAETSTSAQTPQPEQQ